VCSFIIGHCCNTEFIVTVIITWPPDVVVGRYKLYCDSVDRCFNRHLPSVLTQWIQPKPATCWKVHVIGKCMSQT